MHTIMQYTDKGYDVEIWLKETDLDSSYTADIKYPCGELVKGLEHIRSKRDAVYWAINEINDLPFAYHKGCKDDYCANNKYLAAIRGKQSNVELSNQ